MAEKVPIDEIVSPEVQQEIWNAYKMICLDQPLLLPGVTLVLYLLMVFIGPSLMKRFRLGPYDPSFLLNMWNLFLALFSFVIIFRVAQITYPVYMERGWYHILCMPGDRKLWTGEAFFWVVIFCSTKFLELTDTFFLIIRGRQVVFLHWYHHTTVLLYTYYSMVSGHSAGWLFGLVNGFVHVLMYFYYFYSGVTKSRPFWGKYITQLQLFQMIIGIGLTVSWDYYYFTGMECPAEWPMLGIVGGAFMYISYFILFLQFYGRRHTVKRKTT